MRCLRINVLTLEEGKYLRVITDDPMSRTPKSEMYPMIRLISRIVFIDTKIRRTFDLIK